MVSEKHPDDEGAEEFYESTYGNLFKTNPGFRGVVLVGESCEFPSRDPRAYNHLFRYHPKDTPVFLPGESQGQWSLVGCSPWGR